MGGSAGYESSSASHVMMQTAKSLWQADYWFSTVNDHTHLILEFVAYNEDWGHFSFEYVGS